MIGYHNIDAKKAIKIGMVFLESLQLDPKFEGLRSHSLFTTLGDTWIASSHHISLVRRLAQFLTYYSNLKLNLKPFHGTLIPIYHLILIGNIFFNKLKDLITNWGFWSSIFAHTLRDWTLTKSSNLLSTILF